MIMLCYTCYSIRAAAAERCEAARVVTRCGALPVVAGSGGLDVAAATAGTRGGLYVD